MQFFLFLSFLDALQCILNTELQPALTLKRRMCMYIEVLFLRQYFWPFQLYMWADFQQSKTTENTGKVKMLRNCVRALSLSILCTGSILFF